MKSLLLTLIVVALFFSCKNDSNTDVKDLSNDSEENILSLEGTWELVSFYNYLDNKITDSIATSEGYRQVKMYTTTKVMWSKHVPTDTTEWFGYGSYNIDNNHLNETLDYGSEMMSRIIRERKQFVYELNLNKNKFSQIELDEDGNRIYSENYIRIE